MGTKVFVVARCERGILDATKWLQGIKSIAGKMTRMKVYGVEKIVTDGRGHLSGK